MEITYKCPIDAFAQSVGILTRLASKWIRNHEDIKEVLQNCAMKMVRCQLPSFESDKHLFRFHAKIVRHECFNFLNWKRARPEESLSELNHHFVSVSSDIGLVVLIDDLMFGLHSIDQQILRLRIDGYTYSQIAELLETKSSERTVGYRLKKIRQHLQVAMKERNEIGNNPQY